MEVSTEVRGPAGWRSKWRRAGVALLLSAVVVAPCFWQPRIQAGDLSSHIYNAWLSQLIESGRLEGLVLTRQATNVLFDLVLAHLFPLFGAEAAQRIAVSASALLFFWGAFQFLTAVAGSRPWHLAPCVAIFAYGWVFHMGFFNFYLSMALCLWALALLRKGTGWRLPAAGGLLLAAATAHLLPVAWSAGLAVYLWMARRVHPRRRAWLTAAGLLLIGGLHAFLASRYVSKWTPRQFASMTGADQIWVFEAKYYFLLVGLVLMWGLLFLNLLHQRGARRIVLGIPFQFCIMSAAIVVALPDAVLLPGYRHALSYIAERMSLGVGICVCALLGAARPKLWQRVGMVALAGVFFLFLYQDERALNRFEDQMESVVASLPAGQRVISGVTENGTRSNALAHVLDRVCLGRCFSYGNYEPSTAQFRVRARGPNPYVTHSYPDADAILRGGYVPRQKDLPMWQVRLGPDRTLLAVPLAAGSRCSLDTVAVFPKWTVNERAASSVTAAGSSRKSL
jgi:hypothetical protein